MKRYTGHVWKVSKHKSSCGVWGTSFFLNVNSPTWKLFESHARIWRQTKYYNERCSSHPYHSGSYRVLEALCQELGMKIKYFDILISVKMSQLYR